MIGSTLQKELMQLIMRDLHDPRLGGLPSITRVEVSTDLSTADVFVTIMGTEGKQQLALNALKHSAGMMRQKLNKLLPMRTIPFLKFHLDDKLKKEIAVLELIEKARQEEDQRKAEREGQNQPAEPQSADAETQSNTAQ
jgi:ribosome-binding factor A